MDNYYNILGIPTDSSQDQIKKAYKKLAFKWHPDKNKDPSASEKFHSISNAYQILTDPKNKFSYHNSKDREFMSAEELFESLFTPLGNPFFPDINTNDQQFSRINSLFSPFFANHDSHSSFSSINTTSIIQNGKKIETTIKNNNGVQIKTRTVIDILNNRVIERNVSQQQLT
jgi:DnaJ-class molecular chaperone